MSRIRAIILDFDGVLVESNEAKTRAFEDLFALYPAHRDAMRSYHQANHSSPRRMKFEHYVFELMRLPGNSELVQAIERQFSALVSRRVIACADVPGARAFLEEFSRQVPLYISSVTPQDELKQIVRARRIDPYFIDVFGDPPCSKQEAIRHVLSREQVPPSEVLFVGDSRSDYGVALDTGLQFLGRDSGLPFDGLEIDLHPNLFEIAGIVRQWLPG